MKIAISVLGDITIDNGTVARAKRIAELLSLSHDVVIISRGENKVDDGKNLIITPSNTKLWNLKLIPLVRKHEFELIYCIGDLFGFLSYHYFAKNGTKIIMEAEGIKSIEYLHGHLSKKGPNFSVRIRYSFYKRLEKFVIKRADYVVALSKEIQQFYREYNRLIDTVPGFIDEAIFVSKNVHPHPFSSKKVLGIIGPFEKGNINNHFLDFVKTNLNRLDSRISIKAIGKIDDELRFDQARVEFTGYIASLRDYVAELDTLDAVLVPSIAESYGALNKIFEPMAMEKVVFTTPKGYVGLDDVPIGVAIFVAEESDLVDLINLKLFDAAEMSRVGTAARKAVVENYSISKNRDRINRILQRLN